MYRHRGGRGARNPGGALGGTVQNDMLKEYIAQKEYIFPPRPTMRLVTDVVEYSARHTPKCNPISITGYHISEAGSTAVQELAFTLADGIEYVEVALDRGIEINSFAPRLVFLQRPYRFLRGDRKVPCGAEDLVETDEETVRRPTIAAGNSASIRRRPAAR